MPLDVHFNSDDSRNLADSLSDGTCTLRDLNCIMYKLGRPLWNDVQLYRHHNGLPKCHGIIAKLVKGDHKWRWPDKLPQDITEVNASHDDFQNVMALVSQRVPLGQYFTSITQTWQTFVRNQVSSHLRFVERIHPYTDAIQSHVPSEPPLSVAAAWSFRYDDTRIATKWSVAIVTLVAARTAIGLSIGLEGEEGVQLLCSMAADFAASARYKDVYWKVALNDTWSSSESDNDIYLATVGLITLDEWLTTLLGGVNIVADRDSETDEATLKAWSQRQWINFKHVGDLPWQSDVAKESIDRGLLAQFWIRHAAMRGVSNQSGWDLLIPIYESVDVPAWDRFQLSRLSYVAIQVKNSVRAPDYPKVLGPDLSAMDGGGQAHADTIGCLELFLDLRGPLATAHSLVSSSKMVSNTLKQTRHNIYVSGLDEECYPVLNRLHPYARDVAPVVFGLSYLGTNRFDQDFARMVHEGGKEQQEQARRQLDVDAGKFPLIADTHTISRHIWDTNGERLPAVGVEALLHAIDQHCNQSSRWRTTAFQVAQSTATDSDYVDLLLQLWPHVFPSARIAPPSISFIDYDDNVVRSDFSLPFHGNQDQWLERYILNANLYMNTNRLRVYSKTFPILQSSGTGKTKLAVQLSARQAGFLVCTRSNENKGSTSFPENDDLVFDFVSQVKAGSDVGAYHNHKRVACWFGAYLGILAYALEKRMVHSGCFGVFPAAFKPQRPSASDLDHLQAGLSSSSAASSASCSTPSQPFLSCIHPNPAACWTTVVYWLAKAIHDGSDFIEKYNFDLPEPQCPDSRLSQVSPTDPDTSFRYDAAKKNLFRTHMLTSIDMLAQDLWMHSDPGPKQTDPRRGMLTQEALAKHAANLYMKPFLTRLEALLPNGLDRSHFFFLVIDEIMPLMHILPVMRRLWREAEPQSTWLIFTDTNSKIAPLADRQARGSSTRLAVSNHLLVIPPFVHLGFDAVIQHEAKTLQPKLYQGRLTFSDLLATLSYFGRPLWSTNLYRSVEKPKRPHLPNILMKLLTDQEWPNMWPDTANVANFTDPAQTAFHSIMAIAGQRLPLNFVGHSGVGLIQGASAAGLTDSTKAGAHETTAMAFLQQQASRNLRVISKVHDNVNFFVTANVSEPALSLAAASLLRGGRGSDLSHCSTKWSKIVEVLCRAHHAVGLMLGEEGEEGVRLLFSLATDLVASDQLQAERELGSNSTTHDTDKVEDVVHPFAAQCNYICLFDWLVKLFGRANLDPLLLNWTQGYYLNFTHYLRLGSYVYSDPERRDKRLDWKALAEYWWRQVAIYGQPNQPGWDLVIPVYRCKHKPVDTDYFEPTNLSYVAVQIKNRKSDVTASRFFGPSLRHGDTYDLDAFDHACLEIFIDLRSPPVLPHRFEGLEPIASRGELELSPLTRYHLTVSGLNLEVWPLISELTGEASGLLQLLFGHTEAEVARNAPRLHLYDRLLEGLIDIERSKHLLDGDGPAHFWTPVQKSSQQRSATRFSWKRANVAQVGPLYGGDDIVMD
ncbi:hypothetical protein NDA16_003039 [Ustilago loliicola]|nr:hypothetical protein NDA16_003039 [Ustilago loliicola]